MNLYIILSLVLDGFCTQHIARVEACDKITGVKKCKSHYERSGTSDTYMQCSPSRAIPGNKNLAWPKLWFLGFR